MKKLSNQQLAYLMFRLTMGLNFTMHGLVRVFGEFHQFPIEVVQRLEASFLPANIILPIAYVIPIVQLMIGLLLFFGARTRTAIVLGSLLMMGMMFGMTSAQEWTIVKQELFYALCFFFLLFYLDHNCCSFDNGFKN